MKYSLNDFSHNDAWLIFRLDVQVRDQPVDIYMVMDLPAGIVLAFEVVETALSQEQADSLMKLAKAQRGVFPGRLILAKGDPAEICLRKSAESVGINFESLPAPYLEGVLTPLKESFGKHFFSPSTLGYAHLKDEVDDLDRESAKHMLLDSYDPCSCASGKQYKFCCKKIFKEIMAAMIAAEDGHLSEALKWINKAKAIVGETAEVLCREAIVYSYFDPKKSDDILNKCFEINLYHPRAHYIRGLTLEEKGDLCGAAKAYETAIAHYPQSDYYHLNETYNNLGTVFYAMGDLIKAQSAWEKALLLLPSDKVSRKNLAEFVYNRPIEETFLT